MDNENMENEHIKNETKKVFYKQWWFWVVSGAGMFLIMTICVLATALIMSNTNKSAVGEPSVQKTSSSEKNETSASSTQETKVDTFLTNIDKVIEETKGHESRFDSIEEDGEKERILSELGRTMTEITDTSKTLISDSKTSSSDAERVNEKLHEMGNAYNALAKKVEAFHQNPS